MPLHPHQGPAPGDRERGPDDRELMERLAEGDDDALDLLMGRYWTPLVRYAARILLSEDGAEDTVQGAFVTVWEERTKWRPVGTPQAYLYRVVRNLALQERRHWDVRERTASEVARRRQPGSTPFETAARVELREALRRAISELAPRRREAFVLVRYHDLSLREVAEVMGISVQTVANHVSLAAADLRHALSPFED